MEKKVRKIELKKFEIDKDKLDEVMRELGDLFNNNKKFDYKEGACYKASDFINDLKEEEDTEDVDDVIDVLIDDVESIELRLDNLEEEMKRMRKAILYHTKKQSDCKKEKGTKKDE